MKFIYTQHLLNRIRLRKISYNLPREVYLTSKEMYFDKQTNHFIVLSKKEYFGKLRTLAVTFDKSPGRVELVTIHPVDEKDKLQRIKTGRWVKQ